MNDGFREVRPGPTERQVTTENGQVVEVPAHWALLPPGDAALSRRVKRAGPCWKVAEKRGRKVFSRGLWAPAETIASLRAALELERADPAHAKKRDAARQRREREQARYVEEFEAEVAAFLAFAPKHRDLARRLAIAIAARATEVGSGTVGRTKRIPVAERAEAATIAWLRHHTTSYDTMSIPRVKGMRREVRRQLAARSRRILARYRAGEAVEPSACPLEGGLTAYIDDPTGF